MALVQRPFDSYEDYAYLQGGKARKDREFLLAHLEKNTQWFARIFNTATSCLTPGSILCLGARTGAESLGAERAGFLGSVGVDLHPIGPTVLHGDWHYLPMRTHSFQNVYCNSLDHCLLLDRFAAEVQRVLVPDGRFYVMATNRTKTADAWLDAKGHEALYWATSDELRDALCDLGFTLKAEWQHRKWGHYVFGVHP